jgi:hypothetical protein
MNNNIEIKRTFSEAFNANLSKSEFIKKMLKTDKNRKRIIFDFLEKKKLGFYNKIIFTNYTFFYTPNLFFCYYR